MVAIKKNDVSDHQEPEVLVVQKQVEVAPVGSPLEETQAHPSSAGGGERLSFFNRAQFGFAATASMWGSLFLALYLSSGIVVTWGANEVAFLVFFATMAILGAVLTKARCFAVHGKALIGGTAAYTVLGILFHLFMIQPGMALSYLFSVYVVMLIQFSIFMVLRAFGLKLVKAD